MNSKIIGILLILILSTNGHSYAQDSCLNISEIQIDSVGDENEKIPWPLLLSISKDSILVFVAKNSTTPLIGFNILNKKCQWEANMLLGMTIFSLKVIGEEKFCSMYIRFRSAIDRIIEIHMTEVVSEDYLVFQIFRSFRSRILS